MWNPFKKELFTEDEVSEWTRELLHHNASQVCGDDLRERIRWVAEWAFFWATLKLRARHHGK